MTPFPEFETILLTQDGEHVYLTFNRPEQRNALTHQMMEELGRAIGLVEDSVPQARVLILRGTGGFFCAGGDLNAMTDMPPPPGPGEADALFPLYRQFGYVLEKLNRLPLAVVAVVEGPAAGGGFGMACCADIVIVRDEAKFGIPEPRWGFIPSQIIPYIVRRIGEGPTRRLAVTGCIVGGREAHAMGIAHVCCGSDAEVEEAVKAALDDVHRCEPHALAAVKSLILDCAVHDDTAVCDEAAQQLVSLLRKSDARDGIAAFMAKRRPPWAG